MSPLLARLRRTAGFMLVFFVPGRAWPQPAGGGLVVEAAHGRPTEAEKESVRAWLRKFQPDPSNDNNALAMGHTGQAIEGAGALYELTGEPVFLEEMIRLATATLASRNDLAPAPVGHRPLWPGSLAPAWGNVSPGKPGAAHAGPETGDVVGHVAYCALLMLRAAQGQDRNIADSDSQHWGSTLRTRARTFVRLLDQTEDEFVLRWFVRAKDHRGYFPVERSYQQSITTDDNSGEPIPWNQQFMLNHGLQRLAQCHALLGDEPARIRLYDECVAASIAWFFELAEPVRARGEEFYLWRYSPSRFSHVEDAVHASVDAEGIYRAYVSERYQSVLSAEEMSRMAGTLLAAMAIEPGKWAGEVDGSAGKGHAVPTDFPRPGILRLLEFRPRVFPSYVRFVGEAKRTRHDIVAITNLLWARARIDFGAAALVAPGRRVERQPAAGP